MLAGLAFGTYTTAVDRIIADAGGIARRRVGDHAGQRQQARAT